MSRLQSRLDQLGRLPVAIIGGGVSGLYTGWRLRQAQPDQTVAIFEQSDRTGGRLLTWLPFGKEAGLRAELGGMRFFEEQELVWNLMQHMELQMTDFYVDGPNLLWYLRGQRMKAGDADAAAIRYALNQQERGKQPSDLVSQVINAVLGTPENRGVIQELLRKAQPETRQEWDTVKAALTYKGKPLWDLGFWNVLSDVLSYEGYQYTTDSFGYYSLTSNWNAAEALQSISLEFTQNPHYKTLVDGFEQLPKSLRQRYTALGGHLFEKCSFLRFEQNHDGSFILFFRDEAGGEAFLTAEKVVLAMPRRSLDLIQPTSTFNPQAPALKHLFDAVSPYPAFKLFLLYNERWWEGARGIIHGRSICDLPIRQTYYFRPDSCEQPDANSPSYGLLMASYDDARAVDYWKGMEAPRVEREQKREALHKLLAALPAEFSGGRNVAKNPTPPPALHQATPAMLARAKEQLALLHGMDIANIPDPIVGAYADWSQDPFGGGWNFWQPQVDVKEVMTQIKQPLGANVPVYIIGEAFSGVQGWVEGALTTAELVLQKSFQLPRPSWLPKEYYLGW